jgi:hypothetical protein
MGIGILILGESGSGKSTSIRNLKNAGIINVYGKPLPFKEKNAGLKVANEHNWDAIMRMLETAKTDIIVIDDFQGILVNQFMARAKETGFQKFTEMGVSYYNIIRKVESMPEHKRVYFLSHLERDSQGHEKIKTLGKMLDNNVTVEGLFTIVLKSCLVDGKHFFQTHNSGYDTVKSPMGMFADDFIPNDIAEIDKIICEYYGIKVEA